MGFRDKVLKLLDLGPDAGSPDDPVELARVPAYLGPMTVASLREQGFRVSGENAFNVVTDTLSDCRILVRREDLAAATAALAALL
jgi:hypothetical protein